MRIVVNQSVESIDRIFRLGGVLSNQRNIHQGERRVVAIRCVLNDLLKLFGGGAVLFEARKNPENTSACTLHQSGGTIKLIGDDAVEMLVVGMLSDNFL